jgi:pimeloyl-ACP methyl ester carboxylesterase
MVEVNRAVVLLVHGSPGSPRSGDGVVEELTLRRPEVQVRRLAIPGWDQPMPSVGEQLDFDQIVDQLAGQVGSEVRPNLLVGFSAGALFAMGLAAQGLWPLEGLLLLEPMGLPALELVGAESECHAIRAAFDEYFSGVDQAIPDAIRSIMDVWYPAGSYEAMPKPVKDYLQAWAPLNVRDGRAALCARYDREWFGRVAMPTIAT